MPSSPASISKQKNKDARLVLGKEIMSAVHTDMKKTELPSWISPAPHDWGSTKRGKLSADHWRSICTVHLPITLIRLWGARDSDVEADATRTREKEMLDNFMDLVIAVQIASLRHTTPELIKQYEYHAHRYLAQLKTLFKDQALKPNLHALMHIADFMELMGPSHSHNASAFERFIHYMQETGTNMKFGERPLLY